MLSIPWTEYVTNVEIPTRPEKGVEIRHEVKKRKLQYLVHVMRGQRYEILQLIFQEKIVGRRSVGTRRISWLRNLRERFGVTSSNLFKVTVSRVRIAMMIAVWRWYMKKKKNLLTHCFSEGPYFHPIEQYAKPITT